MNAPTSAGLAPIPPRCSARPAEDSARAYVGAFLDARWVRLDKLPDLHIAARDFAACGFVVGVELIDRFRVEIVCRPRGLLARLFRFKLARRWAEFAA